MNSKPYLHGALAVAVSLGFCSCSAAPDRGGTGSFPADAYMTTTSESGALRIEVRSSPQPPSRGTNTIEFTITDVSDGKARDDLTVAVSPWMPAMNHGSSATPTVTPEGGGKYVATPVYLFMPGLWELRTSFSGAGTDHVAPALDIP